MLQEAYQLLKEQYLSPIKENPDLFIGVELEFPIVNCKGGRTDTDVTKKLLAYLGERTDFEVVSRDLDGNVIEVKHSRSNDVILFEFSYNTLEFAFEKADNIRTVEKRFESYLNDIQTFLTTFDHAIEGIGVHPFWAENDNSPVKTPRYQMLMNYLKMAENYPEKNFHSYYDYGGFICGNQVQLDIGKDKLVRLINAFNNIEGAKAFLFANSPFSYDSQDLVLARDFFWEESMHGFYSENVGLHNHLLTSLDDLFVLLGETAMFSVMRECTYLFFEPIRVKDYLTHEMIEAYDVEGNTIWVKPEKTDFTFHRSYHYQSLTRRGTVEFRSVCTQALDESFAPVAFHLGLYCQLEELEQIISKYASLQDTKALHKERSRFLSQNLTKEEIKNMQKFSQELIKCAVSGLKTRGLGEEKYLQHLLSD